MPCSCDRMGMWDRRVSIGQTLNENSGLSTLEPLMELIIAHCTGKYNHSISNEIVRIFRYLKGQPKLGLWYPRDSPSDLEVFSDSDYAGASLDRKSTTGGCQFLGKSLISWQYKKQTIVANSTTEAEYVATANCCGQGRLMVYKCSGLYTSAIWIEVGRFKTTEPTTSLLANNVDLKARIQDKVFAIATLKNDLRKLKGNSVDTKFDKTSVLGKPVLQSSRNQSVVRQPNTFKSERPQMSKQRFASQVDVNNNLSKPVTQHYLPKRRESDFAKPNHIIASSESRNSSKNMPRFSSNDMVHNHYLDEA
ncbi:hypothetical protein Tco_1419812, partial [Tanacetum coccineum]